MQIAQEDEPWGEPLGTLLPLSPGDILTPRVRTGGERGESTAGEVAVWWLGLVSLYQVLIWSVHISCHGKSKQAVSALLVEVLTPRNGYKGASYTQASVRQPTGASPVR